MNYKRKWIPVEPYEIGALESWFSDLSAEGLHLHDVNALYALFEEKEPQRRIYHIEPKNPYHDSRPPTPQSERYEENGWSFVCTLEPHFYIFSAEENTPKLHTDLKEESALYAKHTKGGFLFHYTMNVFIIIGLILLFILEWKKIPSLAAADLQVLHVIPFSDFLVLLLGWLLYMRRQSCMLHLKKDLADGVLRTYRTDWQDPILRRRHILFYAGFALLIIALILDWMPLWALFF